MRWPGRLPGAALVVALVAVAWTVACQPRRPSVVLITVDTTRTDRLGAYGYGRATSPNIDRLAAESVRFDHAYAHVPITLPSHTGIMTGTVPLYHGVRDNGRFIVPDELVTLAELMAGAGYRTAAFVSAFVLDSRYGLDQGFEVYDDEYSNEWSEEDVREARLYNTMVIERPADQTTERALAWLEAVGDEPFFLWVHYYDPHQRYRPPPPYDGMFGGDLYDGEIAFMDAQIGRLLDRLRASGSFDESLVVLTADHGEALGQHGEPTHAVLAYDSTLRVALLIRPPAAAGVAAAVDSRPVSHRDLLPTVASLLDLAVPAQVQGAALFDGDGQTPRERDRPIYFESHLPRFGYGWAPLFGVRVGEWKYIHAPEPELYRVAEDPEELFETAAREPERAAAYEELLFSVVRRESAPGGTRSGGGQLDAETRSRLAALGYVSGGEVALSELTPREPTGRKSPMEAVRFLGGYFAASSLAARGQLDQAARTYEDILLELDPRNPTFLTSLGDLRRQLGDVDAAFDAYRRAQAADPENATVLIELGRLEMDRGRADAAEDLLQAAVRLAPEDLSAAYFAGRVAQVRGEHEEAVRRYERALGIDASHRDTRLQLAVELGRLGRLDEARTTLVNLLTASPFSPRVHYNLGILELRSDQPQRAVASLERALRHSPGYVEARYALGVAKSQAGDREGARHELETVVEQQPESDQATAARRLLAELAVGE